MAKSMSEALIHALAARRALRERDGTFGARGQDEGHPRATRAYAWSSPIEGSTKRRFFAVLHIPPVTSAVEAVRAAIVAEHRSGGENADV